MKKAIIPLFLFFSATLASAQTWFNGTLDQAIAKAQSEKKLVLIDFYSGG